jgi:chitodextrinase
LYVSSVLHLLLAGLFLSAAFGDMAAAATYYLDAVNGYDNNPGTLDQPWRTMAKVETMAQVGDTVIIKSVHDSIFSADWPDGIAYKAPGVTQFGITWTFDQSYQIGRFANGDHWVVGPVTIVGIFPSSFVGDGERTQDGDSWVVANGRVVNGTMIVTDPTIYQEGYDSASTYIVYNEALNVARVDGTPISEENPLEVPVNRSLISSISLNHAHAQYGPAEGYLLKTAAVLTVLSDAAPSGSFRPPYVGTDKAIKFNESQLNYNLLATLDKKDFADSSILKMKDWTDVQGSSAERMIDRPWIDHMGGCWGEVCAPFDNMQRYPGYRCGQLQQAAMLLQVDWTGSPGFVSNNQYKHDLLVSIVQMGIDIYGVYQGGVKKHWIPDGGHGIGRKWPILFAGVMLDGSEAHPDATAMADIGFNNYDDPFFGEDSQSFYVNQRNLDFQAYTYSGGGWPARGWADPDNLCEPYSYLCRDACGPDYRDDFFIPYTQEDVDNNLPEWAIMYRKPVPDGDPYPYPFNAGYHNAYNSNRMWDTEYRRNTNNAQFVGFVLSMHIMDLKDRWNHDSFFDFMDRYIPIEKAIKALIVAGGGSPDYFGSIWKDGKYVPVYYNIPGTPYKDVRGNVVNEPFIWHAVCSSAFVEKMWDEYRAKFGGVWTIDPNGYHPSESDSVPPLTPTNLISTAQTSSTINLSWTAPGQASDGDGASSYKILRNGTLVGLSSGTSFQDTGLSAETSYNYEVYSIDDAGNVSASAAAGTFSTLAKGNQPPSANAGVDQTVTDGDGNGSENVTLDGSASSDADGAIQTYVWREGGSRIATGANPTVTLSVGQHTITLTVTDNGGLTDTDTVTIAVNASGSTDNNPPSVTNGSPASESIQVPLNNLITLHIVDAGKGVDANSVTIKVNNNTVYSGNTANYTSATGNCRRTGTKSDYTFVYQPNEMFDFEQKLTVAVNAADLGGNVMPEYTYSFWTEMRSFGKNKRVSLGLDNLGSAAPATVRDSSGNVWAVWQAGPAGSRDIYVNKLVDEAANFTGSIQLIADPADQCNPGIAVGSSDKLYVVWQDNRRGNWDIYMSTSADGINWSTGKITDSNNNEINPAIAIGSTGRAAITWQDDRAGNQDIYVATSSDGFATKDVVQITRDGFNQTEPAIAVGSDNTVYVVWTDSRSGSNDIYGAASNSGPWTNVPIVNKTGNQSSPTIAAETAGSILHLLWVDDTPGNKDVYYAATDGLPGSPLTGSSIIDPDTAGDQLEPAIAVIGSTGSNLAVFACWQDRRNVAGASGDTDLYFAEVSSDGGTNVFVGDDSTNSNQSQPAIGVDAQGHPYLVWGDSRSANAQIYYAGSTYLDSEAVDSELVAASVGATVGVNPANIDSADDVSVTVPAGACPCDIRITISEIKNPQEFTVQCLAAYDFGPSGIQFNQPVTITIPYAVPASQGSVTPYWFNSLTGALSQQGITDIKDIVISPTLHAVSFKTTHFTPFYVVEGTTGGTGGGGGGGGCSVSASGNGSIVEFLLPYMGLAAAMMILRLRDAHQRKERRLTKSES